MAQTAATDTTLDEVRELARDYNLVPVCETFVEDCETPVSAFLKLRGAGPAGSASASRASESQS